MKRTFAHAVLHCLKLLVFTVLSFLCFVTASQEGKTIIIPNWQKQSPKQLGLEKENEIKEKKIKEKKIGVQ